MADIDALLGLRGRTDTDARALAKELRGQADLGDFLSVSTIKPISDLGASKRKRAIRAAESVGKLRDALSVRKQQQENWQRTFDANEAQRAATNRRADLAEGRAAAEERRRQIEFGRSDRLEYGDLEMFMDPEGNRVPAQQITQGPNTGQYVHADTKEPLSLAGMRRIAKPSSSRRGVGRSYERTDNRGNPIMVAPDGSATWPDTNAPWTQEEADRRAKLEAERKVTSESDEKFAGERAKQRAKVVTESQQGFDRQRRTVAGLQRAVNALRADAETGPISRRLPSFTAATVALEAAQQELAMEMIGDYTFGALSTYEAEWLKSVAVPTGIDQDDLLPFMEWKLQGARNIMAAKRYALEMFQQNKDPDQDKIEELLSQNGYDPYNAPGPTAEVRELDSMTSQMTPEQKARFDSLSPAGKRNILLKWRRNR